MLKIIVFIVLNLIKFYTGKVILIAWFHTVKDYLRVCKLWA